MAKRNLPDIRLKFTANMCDNLSYMTIQTVGGRRVVSYYSSSEVPLALSNMFENAAEVRFALEDAKDANEAVRVARAARQFAKKIEVLP